MNPIVKFFSGLNGLLNKLFGLVNEKTARTIRNSYFFLIFVLCIVGIVMGYRHGKNAARIKSAPIIDNTNEVFDIDISRARDKGNFRSLLESEVINESKDPDLAKARPAGQDRMPVELEKGIVDSQSDRKIKPAELEMKDRIFGDNYRKSPEINSDIRPLKREPRPYERTEAPVVREESRVRPVERKDADVRDPGQNYLEKRRAVPKKTDNLRPRPILKEEGIIRN